MEVECRFTFRGKQILPTMHGRRTVLASVHLSAEHLLDGSIEHREGFLHCLFTVEHQEVGWYCEDVEAQQLVVSAR